MRLIRLLAVLAGMAAAVPALAGRDVYREQSSRAWAASGIARIEIDNPRGRIEVRPSHDGSLHLDALKIVRTEDRQHSLNLSRETRVEVSRDGERLVIKVRYPQRVSVQVDWWELFGGDLTLPRAEVRLVAEVPGGVDVRLHSTSGDLSTEGLAALQTLSTTSGDISVAAASGRIEISTTSGDVNAEDCAVARLSSVSGDITLGHARGPVTASTTSGELRVDAADDSLRLRSVSGDLVVKRAGGGLQATTTSGDIRADEASGRVVIESSSGDVMVHLKAPLRRAEITTVSGEIQADLDDLACTLEMRTSSGDLNASVPIQIHETGRHLLSGGVRGGGVPVILRSSSGDIALTGGGK